ncbi:MAG: nucleotidyltransferase domain-containing protein, partial [Raoultibacter sp.]
SAERNEIDLIVSHDKKAYAVSLVPVVTPCEFVGIYRLENVSYDLVELPIEEVRRIVEPIADKYGAKRVSLFGSRARGDAVAGSDFDILLDKGRIRGMRVLDFQEELSKALRCKVDVATTQGVSARFLEKIQQYEVVLFEAQ